MGNNREVDRLGLLLEEICKDREDLLMRRGTTIEDEAEDHQDEEEISVLGEEAEVVGEDSETMPMTDMDHLDLLAPLDI